MPSAMSPFNLLSPPIPLSLLPSLHSINTSMWEFYADLRDMRLQAHTVLPAGLVALSGTLHLPHECQ